MSPPSSRFSSFSKTKRTTRLATLTLTLSAVVAFAPLAACGTTSWSSAWQQAEASGPAIHQAELALIAKRDPELAAGLAERLLAEAPAGSDTQLRAFSVLVAASDALAAFERPLAHLPAAIDGAITAADPARAEHFAAQAGRAWARLDGESAASPEVRAALERLAKVSGDAWEPARAEALRELVTAERLRAGPAAGRAAAARAGFVLDWRLSAPWGDAPGLDLHEPFGPETRPLAEREQTRAGWALDLVPTTRGTFSDGEVTFFDLPATGGVGFAQATVEVPAPHHATLRFETNRLAELWVGGERVAARVEGSAPWLAIADATLSPGPTLVTVKLASHDGKGFFRLQVSPRSSAPTGRAVAVARAHRPRPGDGRGAVEALLELENRLSRPVWDPQGARAEVAALEARFGPHPSLDLLAARLALGDTTSPAAERREAARTRYDSLLAAMPGHPAALRGLARLEREEQRLDQALALLADTSDPRTALDAMDLLRERGWEVESLRAAEALLPLASGSPRLSQELIDVYRAFGRTAAAQRLAEELEARFPGTGVERLGELLTDRGQPPVDRQLALYRAEPQRHALLRAAVAGLRAVGDLERAEQVLTEFLASRPEDGWALAELARVALQKSDLAGTRERVDAALAIHPDFAPLEGLAHHLADEPERFDRVEDGQAIIARWRAFAATTEGAAFAGHPVVQVLDRSEIEIRADGSTIELTHRVRLVQSKQGADALGDVRPPDGARLLVARTLKADGRILEPERTEGKADLSFPELNPGDAVETAWVSRSRVNPSEGGYLTGLSFASWGAPIFELDARFTTAKGLDLVVTPFGGAPAPDRTSRAGGGTILTWKLAKLPAIAREPLAISARSFFPFADLRVVSAGRGEDEHATWHTIARAYASRLLQLTEAGPRMQARAALLRKGKEPVAAAFAYVKTELADAEQLNAFETAAEAALAARKGNRALVLAALLGELDGGLDAREPGTELFLCAPERDGPPEDRAQPTPNANRFFYPIVATRRAGAVVYLDPSRPYTPVGDLPAELRGARCLAPLRVARGLDPFLELPAGAASRPTFEVVLDLELALSGDARGTLSGTAFGAAASPLRQAFLAQDDERKRIIFEQWLGSLVVGARLIDYRVEDADEADRPMRWQLTIELPGWARHEGEGLVIGRPLKPLVAADFAGVPELAQLVGAPTRETPLRILPHTEQVVLRLRWPRGLSLVEAPPALAGDLAQTTRVSADRIELRRTIDLRPGRVAPADYAAFRERISATIRAIEAPLRFVP